MTSFHFGQKIRIDMVWNKVINVIANLANIETFTPMSILFQYIQTSESVIKQQKLLLFNSTKMTLQISVPDVYPLSFVDDDDHEKTNLALLYDRYKDRFITFPKEKGWMTEDLYMYQGFWHQSKNVVSVETVMATRPRQFQSSSVRCVLSHTSKIWHNMAQSLSFCYCKPKPI